MSAIFLRHLIPLSFVFGAAFVPAVAVAVANTDRPRIGLVLMHGKGGSPMSYVLELARHLEAQGLLVANLEMTWSGRRNYDSPVAAAEAELETAVTSLRGQGAHKVFVAGHSLGGVFALYFGTRHEVDGVIAIAPGGNVANPIYREKLGEYAALSRKLVAQGRGEEKTPLADYEGAKGTYPLVTTPAAYLSWFDPDGAMNQTKSSKAMNPAVPVLFVAPTKDYPGLLRVKQQMFAALPKNSLSRLYEPDSTHVGAPSASAQEIVEWTTAVANAPLVSK